MELNKISAAIRTCTKISLKSAAYTTALLSMAATNVFAADDTQTTAKKAEVEVIQVTGMLASVKAAALLKRTDSRIVDAIVAEDIGKLPDNNIAEALQRITGVSIGSDFGVGESVTIRGISDNLILLNGRSTAGPGRGGINLDDFPSSFLKTVEVVKSPTPDMIEGALGGTVNMKTIRPLELDETLIAFTLDGEYADKTENTAPKFTSAIGSNWDLGDKGSFGASAVFSYQDRELRKDEFFNKVELQDVAGLDPSIDTSNAIINAVDGTQQYLFRNENTVEQLIETRERTALGLSLQWAPASGDGNVYFDFNTTELDGNQAANSILDVGGSVVSIPGSTYIDGNGQLNNYQLDGAFVIPKTKSAFTISETFSHALGAEWSLSDSLLVSGEVSYSKSEETRTSNEFNLRPVEQDTFNAAVLAGTTSDPGAFMHRTVGTYTHGSGIPGVSYEDPLLLSNPQNLAFREFFHKTESTDNEETAARFDIEYSDFGVDWISSIKGGVRITERDFEADRFDLTFDGSTTLKDSYKRNFNADGSFAVFYIDNPILAEHFVDVDYNNSFNQSGISGSGNALTNYTIYDPQQISDSEATYEIVQELLQGTDYQLNGSLSDNLTENDGSYKLINEKTQAFYTQVAFDFGDLTGVIGGRYVKTELESSIREDGSIVTGENDYSDFLPSLNVTYLLTDETVLRFAAAKVMRRADFGELSPSFSIDNSLVSGTQGSFELEPKRVTQYDLSAEHYFGEGGLISAALFYKDVQSFTQTESTCFADASTISGQNTAQFTDICLLDTSGVSQSNIVNATNAQGEAFVQGLVASGNTGIVVETNVNGGSGTVKGIELAYQQKFDSLPGVFSGLGLLTNYTYSDSEQPDGNPLLNISENTFNLQVYWENNDGFEMRLAYNWRDDYLFSQSEKRVVKVGALGLNSSNNDDPTNADTFDPTAGNNYLNARGQLDFSASYDINENFTLVANAVNLLGEETTFSTELGSDWKYRESDVRYTVGLRAKF